MRTFLVVLCVLALVVMACGDDDGSETAATTASTDATVEVETTLQPETTLEPEGSIEEFCEKNVELVEVRVQVYGPPFTETPEEIEALLAEADAVHAEVTALRPEELEEPMSLHYEEFVVPYDALTEELGWDPLAAMNDERAVALEISPANQPAVDEIQAWLAENCEQFPM